MTFFATIFGSCIAVIAAAVGVLTLVDGASIWSAIFFGISLVHIGFVIFVRRSAQPER